MKKRSPDFHAERRQFLKLFTLFGPAVLVACDAPLSSKPPRHGEALPTSAPTRVVPTQEHFTSPSHEGEEAIIVEPEQEAVEPEVEVETLPSWEELQGQVVIARVVIPPGEEANIRYYSANRQDSRPNSVIETYELQGPEPYYYMDRELRLIETGGVVRGIPYGNDFLLLPDGGGTNDMANADLPEVYLGTEYLQPIVDLSPLTFYRDTVVPPTKRIVVTLNPDAEIILFEDDRIVCRAPVVTGHGAKPTNAGEHRVYQAMVNRNMGEYNFVPFFLAFSGDQGIHGGVSWSRDNFTMVSPSEWWGSSGCVNLPPYSSEWAYIEHEGESIPIDEFVWRWASTELVLDVAETEGSKTIASDTVGQLPVLVVRQVDDLLMSVQDEYSDLVAAYRNLRSDGFWKLGEAYVPYDRPEGGVEFDRQGVGAAFRSEVIDQEGLRNTTLSRDIGSLNLSPEDYGCVVHDLLENKALFAHNAEKTFPVASAFKGLLLIALLEQLGIDGWYDLDASYQEAVLLMIRNSGNQETGVILQLFHEFCEYQDQELLGNNPVESFNNWLIFRLELPYSSTRSSGLNAWREGIDEVRQQYDLRFLANDFAPLDLAQGYWWLATQRPDLLELFQELSGEVKSGNPSYLEQLKLVLDAAFAERGFFDLQVQVGGKDGFATGIGDAGNPYTSSPDAGFVRIVRNGEVELFWIFSGMHANEGYAFQNNLQHRHDIIGMMAQEIINTFTTR